MSDQTEVPEASNPPSAPEVRDALLSAGAMLRQAREASGLHIAALAVSMKVPVKKLEALESDRFDLLPDAVFVRALASAMCRALKIDPAPILEKLPQTQTPKLDTEARAINTPFHAPGESAPMALPDMLRSPAAGAVLLLLVGALAVFLWPQSREEAPAPVMPPAAMVAPAQPEAVSANPPPVNPLAPPATQFQDAGVAKLTAEPAPSAAAAPALPSATAPAAAVAATTAPATTAALGAAQATPAVSAASSPAAPVAGRVMGAAAGTGVVAFRVKGASWIEVTDAKGVVQLRRTLQSGESAEAAGALPLSVTVGKADVTTVEVRGKPFSLAELARDNVARFEVK